MQNNKVAWILSALLPVVIVIAMIGYLDVKKEKDILDKVLAVELPMEQAVREIEVSIWESTNAIFYYMTDPSATSLSEYRKQLKDVEAFMLKYKSFIDTVEEKKMLEKFEKMWIVTVFQAEELLKLRNKMTELQEKLWDTVYITDNVIDFEVQHAFVKEPPDQMEKEKAVREVKVSIWEAINATNYYIHSQSDKPKRVFPSQLTDVNVFWGKYKKLNIIDAEAPHIIKFEKTWHHSAALMKECYTLTDELNNKFLAFWESVHKLDDVIDFEIQEYLKKRINILINKKINNI